METEFVWAIKANKNLEFYMMIKYLVKTHLSQCVCFGDKIEKWKSNTGE